MAAIGEGTNEGRDSGSTLAEGSPRLQSPPPATEATAAGDGNSSSEAIINAYRDDGMLSDEPSSQYLTRTPISSTTAGLAAPLPIPHGTPKRLGGGSQQGGPANLHGGGSAARSTSGGSHHSGGGASLPSETFAKPHWPPSTTPRVVGTEELSVLLGYGSVGHINANSGSYADGGPARMGGTLRPSLGQREDSR